MKHLIIFSFLGIVNSDDIIAKFKLTNNPYYNIRNTATITSEAGDERQYPTSFEETWSFKT